MGKPKTKFDKTLWHHFFKAPNSVVDDTAVDGGMTAVYFALLRYSSPLKHKKTLILGTYTGVRTLSRILSFSERKISYILRRLEDRGLIKRHRQMLGNTVTEMLDLAEVYPAIFESKDAPVETLPVRDLRRVK